MKANKPRVLIRADAGSGIGYGHLVRCLSVAGELTRRGALVTVAIRSPSEGAAARIHTARAEIHRMPSAPNVTRNIHNVIEAGAQKRDALETLEAGAGVWDAIIVDHYGLDIEWEAAVRGSTRKLIVVDDLANRRHHADVLVDHNWYGAGTSTRYSGILNADAVQLLGPRYCLLNVAYSQARPTRQPVHNPPQSVLVNFGGNDVAGQTLTATRAALDATTLDIEIVLGSKALITEELMTLVDSEPRVSLHVALSNLASLLGRVDLVMGASGTGTWERLCMGVPSIVTTVSDSQSGVTRALSDSGHCTWLGIATNVTTAHYAEALTAAEQQGVNAPPAIVDGYGSARLALQIIGPNLESIVSKGAVASDDASYVSSIAERDPDSGPAQWRTFERDFHKRRSSGDDLRLLFVEGIPIGTEIHLQSGEVQRFIDRCIDEGGISWLK